LSSIKTSTPELRLRVLAVPNGSGKSKIIKSVRNTDINGHPIDLGYYINADDITQSLKKEKFSLSSFGIKINNFDCRSGDQAAAERKNVLNLVQDVLILKKH
jgi:predicted ABC-type ATPase